jgi:hypothetical protein
MKIFIKLTADNRVAGLTMQNMKNPILPDECVDVTDTILPDDFAREYHRYIYENGSLRLQTDAERLANDFPDEDYWIKLRQDRNDLLLETDWTQSPDSPLSDEQKQLWRTYRAALRSLPETTTDPRHPTWPAKP